jgi:hypothetical protein
VPEGAEVLVVNERQLPILYVDEVTTKGRMVVTSLDPFYHHGSHFMPATTRFLDGFLPWVREDISMENPRNDRRHAVHEAGRELRYTFADLMHYHGFGFPGGVAHAFKVMQRALPLLAPTGRRSGARSRSAPRSPGPGARDAFEMVTRGLTEGRYVVDAALERPSSAARR